MNSASSVECSILCQTISQIISENITKQKGKFSSVSCSPNKFPEIILLTRIAPLKKRRKKKERKAQSNTKY